MTSPTLATQLEQYTIKRPQEVLLVNIEVAGEPDQIAIFKGFSSSLMRPTAFDPDVPVMPADAVILSIDRVASPYTPDNPTYLQQGLSLDQMRSLLNEVGLT